MKKSYKTIVIIAAVVAVGMIAAAIGLGMHNQSMAAYSEKLAQADKMMEDQDYQNAVLKYQEAIADKPKEEEGYLSLADAYIITGHTDYALETVEKGLSFIPDSERLKAKKDELSGQGKKTAEMTFNDTLLGNLSSKSFYDYGQTNSIEKVKALNEGAVSVRVKGIGADLIYMNTAGHPNTVDGNSPSADSLPTEVHFDNIMDIFGGGDSITMDDLKSMGAEDVTVAEHQEFGSAVSFNYSLYNFVVKSDKNGNIKAGADNIVTIPDPSGKGGGDTDVKGTVINAVNGSGVSNAKLIFRKSGSSESYEVKTDSEGKFTAKLDSGDYSVDCKAEGFIDETKSVYVPSYAGNWNCELTMSPEMNGEARIVLTWGSYPSDLDSHLIGNGVHVSWLNTSTSAAELDLDDQDGYGPETTTIYDLSGDYTFVVHDFTNSGDIGSSGAEATVYLPGQEPVTISLSGSGSNTWVVCSITNGKLDIINEVRDYDIE